MNEEHGGEVERRHRRIEQEQHRRAGDEAAHLVQAAQRLHVAAVAGPGAVVTMLASTGPPRMVSILVASRPSTWRRSVSSSDSTHDEAERQQRQHDQRFDAAAGQDAIGDLEQVDRHRQHQQIDEDRKCRDRDQVRRATERQAAHGLTGPI